MSLATGVTVDVQVQVPNDMMGAIIGKGGVNIKEIRSQSGCRIDIVKSDGGPMRLVKINGTSEQTQMAQYMLSQKMAS